MSKKLEPQLHVNIQRSQTLAYFIIGLHLLSLLACFKISVLWQLQLVLVLVLGLSFSRQFRRYQQGVYQFCLQCTPENTWQYAVNQHDFVGIEILPSSVLNTWLIILHVKTEAGKRENLLICKDTVNEDLYRRLKVRLKITAS